ncbi:uncharacterized protein [Leptinotarsa decemlineata]|uniref:uncharacterized protein n=1 Tax=Leptinotarsa decemlineata TaxID=7539 RepID=UPI003D305373
MYSCDCGKSFTRSDNLRRHQLQSCQGGPAVKRVRVDNATTMYTCNCCNVTIPMTQVNSHRRTMSHKNNACVQLSDGVQIITNAFNCRIATYRVESSIVTSDYMSFFNEIRQKVIELLESAIRIHKSIKVNMEVFGNYILQTDDSRDTKSFNSQNKIVDQSSDLNAVFDGFRDVIVAQTTEFQDRDSGWTCEKILFLEVNINKYSPLEGRSYVKLPQCIQWKKDVVNVRNEDQYCFAWAITSALYPADSRVSELTSYPHFSTVLDVTGMDFPVKVNNKSIEIFEDRNDISINVYGLESTFEKGKMKYEVIGPLRYSQRRLRRHVNLLFITDDSGNGHYCWIKDLSRLVSNQLSAHRQKKYFCDGCLIYFSDERLLLRHNMYDCNYISTTTPTTNLKINKYGRMVAENKLLFENFERQMRVPFVVYADFESVLKPIHVNEPNPESSYTIKTFKHAPYSFAYLIKCSYNDDLSKFVTYRGVDAAQKFVSSIEDDLKEIHENHLRNPKPMDTQTDEEEEQFAAARTCGICNKAFTDGEVKVRDHCHVTGKKRSHAAHSKCNLNFKIPNFIPIIFHNLSGYDCHLFIKELYRNKERVDVIPQTKEKYISFTKHLFTHSYTDKDGVVRKNYLKMRFIDSYKFMTNSLEKLGANLTSDQCLEMHKHFPQIEKFNLMRQKGVFPYSFVDDIDKLNYPLLPTKNQFYDTLNCEHISETDYDRARNVWNLFECQNLGEYSDLYLKSDVLLLCDIFENFRTTSLEIYNLDPVQYYTAPGLSWDAMLKFTNVELELLTDIDMIHFFQKGIRGGISQCSERKHIANNRFLPNYNPKEPSTFITYLDATNLYGHSMSQPLPTSEFTWLTPNEILNLDVMDVSTDSPYGYVFEVDIHYPQELHDKHSDLPFLVEKIIPPRTQSKTPKLISNLNDKRKYIVHYRNLQQAVKNGLIVMNTHRVLKFKQSCWMKPYIDLNTEMRNRSNNKSVKDFYKLMNNAVYGKTMENVDNRIDVRLVTHWENIKKNIGASTLIAKPNFKNCSIFTDNFVAIQLSRVKVHYDKPLYLGFSILELSKTVMYDFFYGCIKQHFDENVSLLYTDTDSLILKVNTENFYEFIKTNISRFDTSNYSIVNQFNIPVTSSVLGNFKDEFPNDPIMSFYGTGAKAYYVKSVDGEFKKAKGVKRSVIKNELTCEDYQKIVEKGGMIFRKMNSFRSVLHDMYTELKNKDALSYHDDKRFIIPNTTHTLPWGHNDIEFYENDPNENIRWISNIIQQSQSQETPLDQLINLLSAEIND